MVQFYWYFNGLHFHVKERICYLSWSDKIIAFKRIPQIWTESYAVEETFCLF